MRARRFEVWTNESRSIPSTRSRLLQSAINLRVFPCLVRVMGRNLEDVPCKQGFGRQGRKRRREWPERGDFRTGGVCTLTRSQLLTLPAEGSFPRPSTALPGRSSAGERESHIGYTDDHAEVVLVWNRLANRQDRKRFDPRQSVWRPSPRAIRLRVQRKSNQRRFRTAVQLSTKQCLQRDSHHELLCCSLAGVFQGARKPVASSPRIDAANDCPPRIVEPMPHGRGVQFLDTL